MVTNSVYEFNYMDKKKYIEVNHESITCGYTRLDIIGDMLDPDQITKLLSIVPRITWKRGKTLSSKGHEIEFIDSGWELIAENTDLTYHQQIEYWYNLLKYKTKTLKQFRKNGYKIKLNLLYFFYYPFGYYFHIKIKNNQ